MTRTNIVTMLPCELKMEEVERLVCVFNHLFWTCQFTRYYLLDFSLEIVSDEFKGKVGALPT